MISGLVGVLVIIGFVLNLSSVSTLTGWYIDPNDSTKEKYWNGSMWQRGNRLRQENARVMEVEGAKRPTPNRAERSHEAYVVELLEAALVEQRRSANYLAIITYITVVLLVLGVVGVVVGALAGR